MDMMAIAKIIIALIAINYIVNLVMNFLGVKVEFYGSYLLWLFALLIFWAILPQPTNYFT